jgi:hypothetical protein
MFDELVAGLSDGGACSAESEEGCGGGCMVVSILFEVDWIVER